MLGCGVLRLVVMVVAVVKGHEGVQEGCLNINELGACTEDHGPIHPTDGQSVYLGSVRGRGYWTYPKSDGWVDSYQHDIRTITETEDSWARWIWHDCGHQYVCLESAKYPNYYFYSTPGEFHAISYSVAPKTDYWTRQRVNSNWTSSRGLYMHLVDERWYNEGYRLGLSIYIYIPPRCEGYKKVVDQINNSPVEYHYRYTYQRGIISTTRRSVTSAVTFDSSLNAEIVKGIVAASQSRSFSISWMNEQTTAISEHQSHESSVVIPPMKRMVIWQKVATYGHYAWNSGVYFVLCVSDF